MVFGVCVSSVDIYGGSITNINLGYLSIEDYGFTIKLNNTEFSYDSLTFQLENIEKDDIVIRYDNGTLDDIRISYMELDYKTNTFDSGDLIYKYDGDKLCSITEKTLRYQTINNVNRVY